MPPKKSKTKKAKVKATEEEQDSKSKMPPPTSNKFQPRPFVDESDSDSEFSDLESDSGVLDEIPLGENKLKELEPIALETSKKIKNSKKKKKKKVQEEERGVIYLGHIPYGFFEDQMFGFFSQFGTITRMRLARNKKTGKSKHFAFLEFETPEVADIVADSMNNYMMFDRTLVCHVVQKSDLHPSTFRGCGKHNIVARWTPNQFKKLAQAAHNKSRNAEQQQKRIDRLLARETAKRKKLKELGIDYDFKGYAAMAQPRAKRVKL